jgi:putative ABC transport system permease protein
MTGPSLPRVVSSLIEWLVADPVARAGLIGDLAERYALRAPPGSFGRALWLSQEVLAVALLYSRQRAGARLDTLRLDLSFTLRSMARRPSFAFLVVTTLALGIGANASIFSVVNGLLIEPLPFEDSDRLVVVDELEPSGFTASVSFPNYRDWKERARSFDRFSIVLPGSRRFVAGTGARMVDVAWVAGGFFETLVTRPALGRYFIEAESEPGAPAIVVLSHRFWSDALGADPRVVGRSIVLGDETFTVVGVTPPDFLPIHDAEAFLPLGLLAAALPWDDRATSVGAEVVARLGPERGLEAARAELESIGDAIVEETGEVTGVGRITPLRDYLVGDAGRQSLMLMVAVALVLLVACANVANLLVLSSERRTGEMALRTALGASRRRIHRQLLTETMVLGILGGATGLALSVLGVDLLLKLVGDTLPTGFAARVGVDGRVVGFTAALAIGTSFFAGFLPAFRGAGVDLAHRIRSSAASVGVSSRARGALVATEVAFSMMLLAGAGLLIVTLTRLQTVEKGFDETGILTLRLQVPDELEPTRETWADFHRTLRERIGALPGVASVASSNHFPLSGNSWEQLYRDEQTAPEDRGESVLLTMVSPSFFDTWGIEVREGRGFTPADRWGDAPVAMVDESLAAARWPGESPLGKRIAFEKVPGPDGPEIDLWRTVVGVTRHVRHYELTRPSRIEVYAPLAQSRAWGFTTYLSIRTDGQPTSLIPAVRNLLRDVEPDATLYRIRTAHSVVEREMGLQRAMRELLLVMAAIALTLGCIGIYSVVSHSTTLRLKELGLRIALGGRPARVTGLIVRESLGSIVVGIGLGTAGALGLGHALRAALYEVSPADPRVLTGAATLLFLVATVSAWLPARRAARVSPQQVLRSD